jgi:hypothetical protein
MINVFEKLAIEGECLTGGVRPDISEHVIRPPDHLPLLHDEEIR